METVLIILALFAGGAFLFSLFSGDGLKAAMGSALGGAFMGGSCMLQLLIPVVLLMVGLWLFGAIFG